MSDKREEFLKELYTGIGLILREEHKQVSYPEFRARMQKTKTEDIRKQVLELRKVLKAKK